MTNKHFDDFEKNVIINYSIIDNNFVDNFYNFYLRERPELSVMHDVYIEKNLPKLIKPQSLYNATKEKDVEDCINTIKIAHKIELINQDINQRLSHVNKSIISELKSKFNLNRKDNIDLIGYKFIKLLENSETKITIKGQIYIDIAKELSLILNKESEYIDFENYCMEKFSHQHMPELRRSYINDINTSLSKKASEKAEKELFPNKNRIDYEDFSRKISKFIQGGTPDIYKYIIENKKFPENPNLPPLRMLSNKNADIVRLADAFGISLRDASKIFGTLVVSKERSPNARTEFYFFLKAYCPNLYA